MKKFIFLFVVIGFLFGCGKSRTDGKLSKKDIWQVLELVDEFGDATGGKRLSYMTTGTIRNNNVSVQVFVDRPESIDVAVFEYDIKKSLSDNLFSYKIGDTKIENVRLTGDSIYYEKDGNESNSLLYLLKQGGLIQFSVYEDGSFYRFDVNADNFRTLLAETFTNNWSRLKYVCHIEDARGKKLSVEFWLNFVWTIEHEELLKDNPNIQKTAIEFFQDKNYDSMIIGGRIQREKIEQDWEKPLFEKVKDIFSAEFKLEPSSFSISERYG